MMADDNASPRQQIDNLDYLRGGVHAVASSSSMLASSSPYLNDPRLRDWIASHYLRRNGPDRPTYSDTTYLIPALADLKDDARIEAMIAQERTINPRFAAWLEEGFVSQLTQRDFERFGPETVGGIYYRYQVDQGVALNLGRATIEPRSAYEFIRVRFGQIHDYEHILCGGGFDTLGEIVPYFARMAALHRHLSPDLAHAFSDLYVLGGFRLMVRGGLNYPAIFLPMLDAMQRAIRVGTESEPIFMARFEDVLDLTPVEARERLGVRHAVDLDTLEISRIFDDLAAG